MYDYLIVGAGLYGAVYAQQKMKAGYKCLVVDRRNHIAGNIYTENIAGIEVHRYGAHIFHTDKEEVWTYINQFARFNPYIHTPIANYKGELYNMPFNMNTFVKMWDVRTPQEAQDKINKQIADAGITEPKNLEEQAISLVGTDIYEKLVKGYTEKQWGRSCKELPAFIIKRLPVRMTFNNNYFNHPYQGIPSEGYTKMVERMLEGIDVLLNVDFLAQREELSKKAKKIVYTGPIDEFYAYQFGELQYRSLCFETEILDMSNYQGVSVMNYTDGNTPYTRIIEHKHFCLNAGDTEKTVITKEFSKKWLPGEEAYYPINDEANEMLYRKYAALAEKEENVIFGGRLGSYRYMDMDQVIFQALEDAKKDW